MPPLCCLRVLADWTSDLPRCELGHALTDRAAAGFQRAAQDLPTKQDGALEFAVTLREHMRSVTDESYSRIRAWILEAPLQAAVVAFLMASLKSMCQPAVAALARGPPSNSRHDARDLPP
eukprot:3558258-Amphidinium_carterae.1